MVAGTHAIISRDVRQEKLRPICVLCNLCANLVTRAPINIRSADKTFFHIDLAIVMHSRVCLSKNNCKSYRNKSCALSKMKFVRTVLFSIFGCRATKSPKVSQLIIINLKKIISEWLFNTRSKKLSLPLSSFLSLNISIILNIKFYDDSLH